MTRPPTRYLFGNGSLDDALAVFDGYDAAMDNVRGDNGSIS